MRVGTSRLEVAGRWWLAGYFEPSSFLQERLSRGAWKGEDEGGLLVMNGMYTCILGFVWLVVVGGRD